MNRQDAIAEISKQIPDCEKCPLIVANCKKQGHYDGCMKQRKAIKTAIEALSTEIVRCKDCKHMIINKNHEDKPMICCLTMMCGTTDAD